MVSPASADDAEGAAELLRAAYADRVTTVDGVRCRIEATRPEERRATWKAGEAEAVVGWAFAGLDAFADRGARAFAGIAVHPLAHAAAAEITLVTNQNDDSHTPMRAINRKLGYRPRAGGCTCVLERRRDPIPASPRAGENRMTASIRA